MARVTIEILSGRRAGESLELDADTVRVGRAATNEIVLEEEQISGEHVRLLAGVEGWLAEDSASTNGTF
ncbi:MAG TPA: FHA domain-containing protein, partial [Polyangiaceae bacterium]